MCDPYDPTHLEPIEGFDGRYQIAPTGAVWSLHGDEPTKKETFDGEHGPRVALYRDGRRVYQPYVHVLVRRTFGEDRESTVEDLSWYIRQHYGGCREVDDWMEEAFEAA